MEMPERSPAMSYRNLAIDALSKCMGYDPYLPQSDAMILAWAEALERARLNDEADILEAVTRMYAQYGDPGWRPTPKVLVETAHQCRKERLAQQAADAEKRAALEGPQRYTFAEFRKRHPNVRFPRFGKEVPDGQ